MLIENINLAVKEWGIKTLNPEVTTGLSVSGYASSYGIRGDVHLHLLDFYELIFVFI